ncbi:hypothetical protein PJJ87_29035, partial [Mycobacterium kansasii]
MPADRDRVIARPARTRRPGAGTRCGDAEKYCGVRHFPGQTALLAVGAVTALYGVLQASVAAD